MTDSQITKQMMDNAHQGKRGGHKRGCEYFSQFDDIEIEGVTFRFLLYLHSKFFTWHVRTFVQCQDKYILGHF